MSSYKLQFLECHPSNWLPPWWDLLIWRFSPFCLHIRLGILSLRLRIEGNQIRCGLVGGFKLFATPYYPDVNLPNFFYINKHRRERFSLKLVCHVVASAMSIIPRHWWWWLLLLDSAPPPPLQSKKGVCKRIFYMIFKCISWFQMDT